MTYSHAPGEVDRGREEGEGEEIECIGGKVHQRKSTFLIDSFDCIIQHFFFLIYIVVFVRWIFLIPNGFFFSVSTHFTPKKHVSYLET